jgi:membrane-associated phospholipid phosphatase
MLNNQIFFALYGLAHQSAFFDWLAAFFAQTFPYFVLVGAGIFLLFHHEVFSAEHPFRALAQKWKEIVLVFFSGVFAWVLAHFLKVLFHTPRPFIEFSSVHNLISETGYAFPSGHATFYMGLAVAIFLTHKKAGYWFMFFALLVGLARIITGVHFPVDILGGFILGAGIAYLVKSLYNRLHWK